MNIIMVDDEKWALEDLRSKCSDMDVDIVGVFNSAREAVEFTVRGEVKADLAFLDIEMPDMNGIELGEKLKYMNPGISIVYLTAYDDRFKEAYTRVQPEDYLLKPCDRKLIERTINRARAMKPVEKVKLKTFGGFKVMVGNKTLDFSSKTKAKELLAMCVDSLGVEVTVAKAVETLWPGTDPDDLSKRSYYRTLTVFIKRIFSESGFDNVFISRKGSCRVDIDMVDCDYVDVMNGTVDIMDTNYNGDYMPEYAWAAKTNDFLKKRKMS